MKIKTMNIGRRTLTKKSPNNLHNAFGIQKWLVVNGYCKSKISKYRVDAEEYAKLILGFCKYHSPLWNKYRQASCENFIQNRFDAFMKYTHDHYRLNESQPNNEASSKNENQDS